MSEHGLFVYGTLLSRGAMAGLLGRMRRLPARVHGTLYRLPEGYPALRPGGPGWVHGELIEDGPTATMLAVLDAYEGVSADGFERRRVTAHTGLRQVAVWAWVMADPRRRGGTPIPDGRWRTWGAR